MMMLDADTQKQVRGLLANLKNPVEIVVYTTPLLSGEVGLQQETLSLYQEIASLNSNITVLEKLLSEGQEQGITRAPTALFREANSVRNNIRFLGVPSGYEFRTVLETLLMLGGVGAELGEKTKEDLKSITEPVTMQSFVTPTCPYCPPAVMAGFKFAYHNPNIIAEGIEASEFPQLSQQYRISGVPDTIVQGKRTERVLGGQPERVFMQAVQKVMA